jgi:hypothetical protein
MIGCQVLLVLACATLPSTPSPDRVLGRVLMPVSAMRGAMWVDGPCCVPFSMAPSGFTGARPTNPLSVRAAGLEVDIRPVHRMPPSAVGGDTSLAVGSRALLVRLGGNRLKMTWVHARPIATEMVDLKPIGDWPDERFVDGAVRHHGPTLREHYQHVAVARRLVRQKPALAGPVNEACEAFTQWRVSSGHAPIYTALAIVHSAEV